MNLYDKIPQTGELWLRSTNDKRIPATTCLSAIYQKYAATYPTFFKELTSNNITRFDVFYDTIFVETPSGYIYEKTIPDGDQLLPYSSYNFYTPIIPKRTGYAGFSTRSNYWFDEKNNKIYYTYAAPLDENKNVNTRFSFTLHLCKFDIKTANIETLIFDRVRLVFGFSENWSNTNLFLEDPCLTFNETTRLFNVSLLLKNSVREFGLISINISQGDGGLRDIFYVTEANAFLPFLNLDVENCSVVPYDPYAPLPYHILTVAARKKDPAYNLRYIKADIAGFDINKPDQKYLVLE
jgi:hypothetical protein